MDYKNKIDKHQQDHQSSNMREQGQILDVELILNHSLSNF